MARPACVVFPGIPNHIAQRGTRREAVFFNDEDRRSYLELVAEAAEKFGAGFRAWCLLPNHVHPNHVHFVAVPEDERSHARCFGMAQTANSLRM